jgi:predicted Zn-dependent protease
MQQALAIDPLSFLVRTINGWILMNAREFDPAIVEMQKSLELHPGFPLTHCILGQVLAAQGKAVEAGGAFQKAVDFSSRAPWTLATLVMVMR